MMVNTTIYGYMRDGEVLCTDCFSIDEALEPHSDTITRLYYLDDEDPHGLTCDGCSGYIFDPVEPHPFRPDPDYSACRECGDECGDDCGLHTQPDDEPED